MREHVLKLTGEIHLDARRAVWLPSDETLAVADLHLGEAWARRARGQLVPVTSGDDTLRRLKTLIDDYTPARTVILGDIVHAAISSEGVEESVRNLVALGAGKTRMELCLGNHDRHLVKHLRTWKIDAITCSQADLPEAVLFHGDQALKISDNDTRWQILGHEHPALMLGDGVATHAKVPCFLAGPRTLVLPAFSDWAGGCVVGRDDFLGETARHAGFTHAIACMGGKLLRIPLTPGKVSLNRSSPV